MVNRRGNRRAVVVRARPQMQGMFTGKVVRNLPIEPPQFNETPMYPLTVEIRQPFQPATGYNLTPKILADKIRSQFQGVTGGSINMKLLSMVIWGVADAISVTPEVNADVSNLSPQVDDNVSTTAPIGVFYGLAAKLRDAGTLNRPCKVGWRWSMADQSRVINEAADFEIMNWAVAGTATSIVRVRLMFSFAGAAAPQGP
eukprot:TRINITY_DN447_c0_g2_i2.p1 TRINITY_DN447_c0_g2~~TRINITY_DN447_c0_g2_i2.p1  ORF type:complete len:200 (+),score=26.33 TRINITY_DN447_c0_g2_i2:115-714(+)